MITVTSDNIKRLSLQKKNFHIIAKKSSRIVIPKETEKYSNEYHSDTACIKHLFVLMANYCQITFLTLYVKQNENVNQTDSTRSVIVMSH